MAETNPVTDPFQVHAAAKSRPRALGRGLESLLPSRPSPAPADVHAEAAPPPATRFLAVQLIDHNPFQTRRQIEDEAFEELKRSIAQKGLMQPIIVRPAEGGRFQIMGGERRFLACKQLGHDKIQAHVVQASDQEALETTIVENLLREDLNPLEQAQAFGRLASQFGHQHEDIALRTGKSRSSVTNYLRLLRLPEDIQQALADGRLTMGHAKALLTLGDPATISELAAKVIAQEISVRKTEELVALNINGRPSRKPKPARVVDPNVREVEERLQSTLGMKVRVEDRGGKGKITIEYGSLDDFERLMESLAPEKR